MIRFLLRKFFYDLWDNLFKLMLLNMGFLGILVLAFTVPPFLDFIPALGTAAFAVLIFAVIVYLCAAALALKSVSDYRSFDAGDFFGSLKPACLPALVLSLLFLVVFFLVRFAVPFYLAQGTLPGIAFAAVCFWTALIFSGAFQFFPAVFSRLEKRPVKAAGKCLLIFFDNIPFSLFSLFFAAVLSIPVIFSPAFPLLYLDQALRLRLLKYDWLEAEAGTEHVPKEGNKRRKIPWREILAGEMEKTGRRDWKDFVFPWR
ncbi:MAG: hypothetical protein LBI67_05215 [Treponema sp.]|jgi:hypothetical protein|nr:hypothetical protein [Treponema sp.]